jgi:hypothetical protein
VGDALAAAAAAAPPRFVTRIAFEDDRMVAMWEGDAGYESGDSAAPGARHRLIMVEGTWSYERDGDRG